MPPWFKSSSASVWLLNIKELPNLSFRTLSNNDNIHTSMAVMSSDESYMWRPGWGEDSLACFFVTVITDVTKERPEATEGHS